MECHAWYRFLISIEGKCLKGHGCFTLVPPFSHLSAFQFCSQQGFQAKSHLCVDCLDLPGHIFATSLSWSNSPPHFWISRGNSEPSIQFSSVQSISHVRLFLTPWIAARQASLSITNSRSSPRLTSIESVMPEPSHPLLSPSPPAPNPSQHQSLFQWVNSSHEVAKILEFPLEHHSLQRSPRADLLQNGLVGSLCSPRDSQESSPTPQFKSINSLALSLLHSPSLTSIHDHRKNHSLD